MSPEQCAGAGGVDAQTDVYALGCVLYELLAGRTPFVANGAGQLIGMHLFQEPPSLLSVAPQTPPEIAELVHRMLRKEKTQRPRMKEAANELARQLSRQTGGRMEVRPPPQVGTGRAETSAMPGVEQVSTIGRSIGQSVKPQAGTKRGLALWGGGGAVAMTLVGVLWVSTRPGSKPQPPVQATKPSTAETAEPNRERPDLGATPPASSGEMRSGESPKETAKPVAETEPVAAAKPKTPATGKSRTGVQPVQPANKTPPKKRIGYEE